MTPTDLEILIDEAPPNHAVPSDHLDALVAADPPSESICEFEELPFVVMDVAGLGGQ